MTEGDVASDATTDTQGGIDAKVFGVLMLLAVIAAALLIPISAHVLNQLGGEPSEHLPYGKATGIAVVELVFTAVAAAVGLALGSKTGLGAANCRDLIRTETTLRSPVVFSVISGLILGGLFAGVGFAFKSFFPPARIELVPPPRWMGVITSLGAGIKEEIWLRLGLITFLAWLGTRVTTRTTIVIWSANLLAALAFAAAHLPQTKEVYSLTGPVIAFVMLGNAGPGLVFGWLYWRHGLLCAMISHTCFDIILKVVVPLLSS